MENALNEEIIKEVMGIVESKWNELNETKTIKEDSQKSINMKYKLFIQFILTFLFTIFYYYVILNPVFEEVVSYINTPSFPLELVIQLPMDIDIECEIALFNENGLINESRICPKYQKFINLSKVFNKNIILENEKVLKIFFYVNDKNYTKFQNERVSIINNIYSFNKDNKVVSYFRYKYFHLDSVIKSSNERKETKYFYYNVQSHRINNENEIYNFNIIDDAEIIRYFSWENYNYLKNCNFVIYLKKMEYFKLTERKRRPFLEVFLVLFGIGEFLLKIVLYFVKKQKIEKSLKNSSILLANENTHNNDINIELENQNH